MKKKIITIIAGILALIGGFFAMKDTGLLGGVSDHSAISSNLPLNNGLVGYWTFDGNTAVPTTVNYADRSGHGNDVATTGFPAPVAGKIGQALNFNGSSQYANTYSLSGIGTTNTVTFSAWIYSNANQPSYTGILISRVGSNGLAGLHISGGGSANTLTWGWNGSSAEYDANTGLVIPNGKWTFIAGVITPTTSTVYMNGQVYTTSAFSNNTQNLDGRWEIANDSSFSRYFNGNIDDARVYNRSLSASEILQLYNQGKTQIDHSIVPTGSTLANNLVGYWSMDGQTINGTAMADQSGQGNTGTLIGSPTKTVGKIGQGLQFDGSSQYIDAGTPVMPTSAFTLSGWIYPTSYASVQGQIISKGYDGSNTQWELILLNSGKAQIDTYVSPTQKGVTSNATIPLNKWTYLTGSFDGTTWRIYVNGTLDSSNVQSAPVATSAKLEIGAADIIGSPGQYFPGKIDDARIYNRALSNTEIKQLYQQDPHIDISMTSNKLPINNGLVGYWTADGKTINGTSMTDASGNGNTGTLVATPVPAIGKIGQALAFNGSSQYVTLPNLGASVSGGSPRSISAWIYPTSAAGNISVFSYGSNSFGTELGLLYNIHTKDIYIYSNGNDWYTADNVVPLNQWSHVVFAYDGGTTSNSTLHVYINGIAYTLTQSGTNIAINTTNSNYTIGNYYLGSGYFPGSLDDVRVYNRALSASEVKQLYQMGN